MRKFLQIVPNVDTGNRHVEGRTMDTEIKYPRTFHLPWSQSITNDDKVMPTIDYLLGQEVVITEKMDGENTTMRSDKVHARSLDSNSHVSREWVKNFWGTFAYDIPAGYRICGENMFAKHSISYDNLMSYFYGFSMWNGVECLSWNETMEWFELLNITPVNVLYRGTCDFEAFEAVNELVTGNPDKYEGYVVRLARSFYISEFQHLVGKYVRSDHVQTEDHWMHQEVVKNTLAI